MALGLGRPRGQGRSGEQSQSQAVLDFFNNSFLITQQFEGLRALEWEIEGEELITSTSSAYITDEFLQKIVRVKKSSSDE